MRDFDEEINRICNFIKENLVKTKSNGVVIALSGGLDCAVVTALSVKAVGKENVHCYFLIYNLGLPEKNKEHTNLLCKKFGVTYEGNNFVSALSKTSFYNRVLKSTAKKVNALFLKNNNLLMIFSNFYSAMRMRHLRKKANEHKCLVLGTINRSELLIGYYTKFDESGFDLQPILHLYKTEVVELAKHLGIPDEIINRTPSGDIYYGRNKETKLTYQKLDMILKELDEVSIDSYEYEINGVTEEEVSKVVDMVKKAKNKGRFSHFLD